MHYRALARLHRRRAAYWCAVAAALIAATSLWAWLQRHHPWYAWAEWALLVALLFGMVMFVVEGVAGHRSDMTGFSSAQARLDAKGRHYFFARPDGSLVRWHRNHVAPVGAYADESDARDAADTENAKLSARGKYVGPRGESDPSDTRRS